jgi:NADP-dependent 3-hydroxy acid dehydrogenase YdfG
MPTRYLPRDPRGFALNDLVGRRVIVTGASAGIGAAIVRELATRGATVMAIARPSARLDQVCREHGATPYAVDVRNDDEVHQAVQAAADRFQGIDALINNAGNFRLGLVSNGQHPDWREMLDVNILGLLSVTKAVIPWLFQSNMAQIVNISSMSGRRVADPVGGVYAGTKHAIHAISEALRAELYEHGVRVTVVSPGIVRTNFGAYISDSDIRTAAAEGQRKFGLDPVHVAAQVAHVLAAPRDVHMIEVALMSSRQPPA